VPVEVVQVLLKLLFKQKITSVYHHFHSCCKIVDSQTSFTLY